MKAVWSRTSAFSYAIFLVLFLIILSIADLTTQSYTEEYNHDQSDSEEQNYGESEAYSATLTEPMDLTADPRFIDAEPSWKMKLGGNSKVSPPRILKKSKEKRECETPPIASRNLIGSTFKRAKVAVSPEDLMKKLQKEEEGEETTHEKKRSMITEDFWSCESKYEWRDLGSDHYPRYVRTATCKTATCANSFYHCHARRYKLKILKRVALSDTTTYEEPDNLLPGNLRTDWKLVSIEVTHCCECSGRPNI